MDYTLIRSARRSLAIEVTREGELVVRAPQFLPQAEIERFLASRSAWINEKLALQSERRSLHPEPDEAERARLLALAKSSLPPRLQYWSEVMGLSPTSLRITGARTRFGSCSGKNGICLSWRLMQYPPEAIDYVLVHELAHIVHKNHGAEFYALVERYLPDWRERRRLLR